MKYVRDIPAPMEQNPRRNINIKTAFCRREIWKERTDGMGRRRVKKSVIVLKIPDARRVELAERSCCDVVDVDQKF